ncbi:MAG: Heavy metal transport/detoxification protein [Parcubacteria group bacterium GW2011_GWC2_42_12]|uniref:Heavy metal transport/detoxification protein n=1 Tax=Candidatus Falkowbacteria bacterium GW2011_GWA2_41_14 TaxID=1618635 RepID=A0A0G0USZ3_9BACT|nr:MAG: Heavy metal transport/detoxification protein [Candidatus Falkowbacteria bacterium GW2011_GWA2_41_14]KKS33795.1 MAG: Heavy metal transport/detoxification protein [Parcubacteria group bacterium GW2011_GWC2_42_12]
MTNTQKFIIPIKGMHCKSCEILVEEQLLEVKHIKKAVVDHRRDIAEIYYHGVSPDLNAINQAIEKAGYSVGKEEKRGWFSKNKSDYQELGMAALFLLGLYFILNGLGLTSLNILPSGDGGVTVSLILLIGLTAGFSTCMALVGGLVLGLSARHNELHPEATAVEKFRPHLFFNLGRVIGYAFLGGLLGLLGSAIQLSAFSLGILTIVVGLVMLVMGLQLVEIFPWAHKLKLTLPKGLSRVLGIGGHQKEYSHKNSAILGASTFFLPCGFTQAMQVIAISTGSFFYGGIVMGLFALGTVPGLLAVGGLTATVRGAFARKFFKFAGLVVLLFALFNISNGLGLTGWNLAYGQTESINLNDPNVTLENGTQVVRMKQLANGYSPNSFTIKQGVPVKWVIDSQSQFSCASSIVMPKYNIRKYLSQGENIIEFTPKEIGRIPFSCSMGMYTGVFNVVDKNGKAPATINLNSTPTANASAGGCGRGGTATASAGGCGGGSAASGASAGSCGGDASGGGGGGCGCGGGAQIKKDSTETIAQVLKDTQIINATYTANNYLQPNSFKVKAGAKVKLTIDVKDDGRGCGYAIMIPGLYDNAIPLQTGQPITMEFTPSDKGNYEITCGMNMITFGAIIVE